MIYVSYICGEIVGIDPLMTKRYQTSFSPFLSLVILKSLVMKSNNGIKQCSQCREFKDISEFSNEKSRSDGKCLNCRQCESERNKRRYHNNLEHSRELKKNQSRKFSIKNKKRQHEWYLKNQERRKKQIDEYRKKNPEYWKIYRKEWVQKNRDKDRAKYKRFRQTEKGKLAMKQANHNRKAKTRGAKGSHTYKEWEEVKLIHQYTCVHCGKTEPEIKLTRDHIKPISKGGTNYIINIQPLCSRCNSKKHNKSESEVKKCRAIQKWLLF